MSKQKSAKSGHPTTTITFNENEQKGELKLIGGSNSDDWNNTLAQQALLAQWTLHSDETTQDRQNSATVAALVGIRPKDELEGMMAAQLTAAHNAAMECYRRAMISGQDLEARRENLNQANKLSRTWTTLLAALDRYRGKSQQKVTVEHVHVNQGGQAVVGVVEQGERLGPGGGDPTNPEEQPYAN
ncbi:MAG: hypothetical protein OXC09_09940 [Truepera sp.]|nr:hypothetical protein [Truepera sp.]